MRRTAVIINVVFLVPVGLSVASVLVLESRS